jgi:hypothetical protein
MVYDMERPHLIKEDKFMTWSRFVGVVRTLDPL